MTRVGLHGLSSRTGRWVLRAMALRGYPVDLVALADRDGLGAGHLAYLLRRDSVLGPFPGGVAGRTAPDATGLLEFDGRPVPVLCAGSGMPWPAVGGVDLAIEAEPHRKWKPWVDHLDAGARSVLLAGASASPEVRTILPGINDGEHAATWGGLVSAGTPALHAAAALVKVLLDEGFGVSGGFLTVLRADGEWQPVVDRPSRREPRSARASGLNVIPVRSGTAGALGVVLPEVRHRLRGCAFLIPKVSVSALDLTIRTERPATRDEVSAAMRNAADTWLGGILGWTDEPVVSGDVSGRPESVVFDAHASMALGDRFFKLVGWFDADWAFAHRVVDLATRMGA